jgi:hypothetical protein
MIFDVPLHSPQALGDTNGNYDDIHLFTVLCLDTVELWLERLALLAPCGPELDESRLSPDVVDQVDGVALQILEGRARGNAPEGERYGTFSRSLRKEWSRHSEGRNDRQPVYEGTRSHHFS